MRDDRHCEGYQIFVIPQERSDCREMLATKFRTVSQVHGQPRAATRGGCSIPWQKGQTYRDARTTRGDRKACHGDLHRGAFHTGMLDFSNLRHARF
ncbi:MAG: hypothetical protein JWM95_1616, partial [Gemmatimonadetes bacterium]|nr:hypothetical protein [Gemmatimonadota bacterium]